MTDRRPGFTDEPAARPVAEREAAPRLPTLLEEEGRGGPVAPIWAPAELAVPGSGWGTLGLATAGAAVLIGAWAAFGLAGLVASQFAVSPFLGLLSLGVVGAGAGLLGASLWREWRGIASLARVDRLRALLADAASPLEPTRAEALSWVRGVAARVPDAGRVVPAIEAAGSVPEITAHLAGSVSQSLAVESARLGRRAAVEGGAVVALVPSPSLDALVAGWRGLRVVREVAALHGLRPGLAGTARLLRRTVSIAATTAGADLLAQTTAESLVGATPVVRQLAASVPGAGITAFRLYRLAIATAAACSPLPFK